MIVRDLTRDDIEHVIRSMRALDRREVYAMRFHDDDDKLIEEYVWQRQWEVVAHAFAAAPGAPAIAIMSVWLIGPRVGSVQMVATDEWPVIAPWAHRWLLRHWVGKVFPQEFNAVECRCWEGHDVARAWLPRGGFREEGFHPGRGKHGEAFVTYAWINPALDMREPDNVHEPMVRRQQGSRPADGDSGGAGTCRVGRGAGFSEPR